MVFLFSALSGVPMEKPKVVILCGGEGTRLKEETEYKPKPMVSIGGMPILWHIMKIYSYHGFKDFVLCLGYKGEAIKQFFLNHELMHHDVTMTLNDRGKDRIHHSSESEEDWTITFADTGLKSMTGARVKRIEKYIDSDNFFLTYGDGLANIDLHKLLTFHKTQKTVATLSGIHPHSRWGLLKHDGNGKVTEFVEKPVLFDYINGGFYCMRKDFFDYLIPNESCVMETEPLTGLAKSGQLSMYKHEGFWHAMDTYKDFLDLNKMWDEGKNPWKVWK
jgi:glucose-1-phosphate cytidylyltransferase